MSTNEEPGSSWYLSLSPVVSGSSVSEPYYPSAQNASAPRKRFSHVIVLALLQWAAVFKARCGNLVFSPACKKSCLSCQLLKEVFGSVTSSPCQLLPCPQQASL